MQLELCGDAESLYSGIALKEMNAHPERSLKLQKMIWFNH